MDGRAWNMNRDNIVEFSEKNGVDIFVYSGEIARGLDLEFIRFVNDLKKQDNVLLILSTNGGDPDAAFKVSRYLQKRYDRFSVVIGGLCKSAGTLLALGAHEIVLSPYGELGPLDVQTTKEDKIVEMQSGLNISEALTALEQRARVLYNEIILDIINASSGIVSFATASKAASEVLGALYGPIFGRFDPEDIGNRSRSMRIASDYGMRLASESKNIVPYNIEVLAQTYPTHSFVIELEEAQGLFVNARETTSFEVALIESIGDNARRQPQRGERPLMSCLSHKEDEENDETGSDGNPATEEAAVEDGGNPPRAGKARRAKTRESGDSGSTQGTS